MISGYDDVHVENQESNLNQSSVYPLYGMLKGGKLGRVFVNSAQVFTCTNQTILTQTAAENANIRNQTTNKNQR